MNMSGVDDQVRQLAQTLKSSGLASSEGEALRMAMSMSSTGKRVNTNFENKRESSIMGIAGYKKREAAKSGISAPGGGGSVQATAEPQYEEPQPAPEAYTDNSLKGMTVSEIADSIKDDSGQTFEQEVAPVEEPAPQAPADDGYEVDKTVELPGSNKEEVQKRDLSGFKEAKVDLSQMFKFG